MNQRQTLLQAYPFERLQKLKQNTTLATDQAHIALSIGEPQHQPPAFIQDILNKGLPYLNKYPKTAGIDALRESLAAWLQQRFKARLTIEQILPVNGSREALFAIAQSLVNPADKPIILIPNPFYQIYEGAALLAGAEPYYYNTDADNNFEPDWQSIPKEIWQRTQLVYTCSPGNPSGKVLSAECLTQLLQLADQYQFVIAADECYSEIYPTDSADGAPLGLLQHCIETGRDDFKNCIVFNSLSKRSNLPGLRSGFVAGDHSLIKTFLQYRTYHGSAMSLLAQHISIAAWQDEQHVIDNRVAYDEKYAAVLPILKPHYACIRPDAAFFIWLPVPANFSDESFALKLYEQCHITVLPGSYLARSGNSKPINPGSKYVRIALVAAVQQCIEAAHRIHQFTEKHQ